jgi:predicted SprT family Zn-dependent metalloprotease
VTATATRQSAGQLARELMDEHGLYDWTLRFDRSVKRFGQCRYSSRTISLSAPLVERNTIERARNTILHEIAHALVGPGHHHNRVWRSKAIEIGCDGRRCYEDAEVQPVPAPWIGTCPSCGYETDRHRLTDKARRAACRACCQGTYDAAYRFVWRRRG